MDTECTKFSCYAASPRDIFFDIPAAASHFYETDFCVLLRARKEQKRKSWCGEKKEKKRPKHNRDRRDR